MPLKPEQLPDDIAELKRRLIETTSELAAAKNGLIVNQLTIEKLKAQIAKLRRSKFGASSERIERALEQLELALEEAETAKAEAVAAQPQQPSRKRQTPRRNRRGGEAREEEAPSAAARVSTPRRRARAARRVQDLRRVRAAHGERDCHRGSGLRTGALRGEPSCAAGLLVPQVRDHGAGTDARFADPARHGRRELLAHIVVASFATTFRFIGRPKLRAIGARHR